jgi:hypothetical protein
MFPAGSLDSSLGQYWITGDELVSPAVTSLLCPKTGTQPISFNDRTSDNILITSRDKAKVQIPPIKESERSNKVSHHGHGFLVDANPWHPYSKPEALL